MKDLRLSLGSRGLCFIAATLSTLMVGGSAQAQQPSEQITRYWRLSEPGTPAHRPQFSPDGSQVVYYAGDEGASDVFVIGVDGTGLARVVGDPPDAERAVDDRDPTWTPEGNRIIWSSNREGSYDLWITRLDGSRTGRVTRHEGDEVEPAVSPIRFSFLAVSEGSCGADVYTVPVDNYLKVVYTRRRDGRSEIWFQSKDGVHEGRVSPEGADCHDPAWSGNGLSLAWVCQRDPGPVVEHSDAQWDQDFRTALSILDDDQGCDYVDPDDWQSDECLSGLPRLYAEYPSEARSTPDDHLDQVTYSHNQILLVATGAGDGGAYTRPRSAGEGAGSAWAEMGLGEMAARHISWSPDGRLVAFESDHEGEPAIYLGEADYYLQEVGDLLDYPELYGAGRSERLHDNRFVARPDDEKEFYTYYDQQVRYQRRAPFVTADAALQAFHDEFSRILRQAEHDAVDALVEMATSLTPYYAARAEADPEARSDRYLAVLFGVTQVLLEAAKEADAARYPSDEDFESEWEYIEAYQAGPSGPGVEARLPDHVPAALEAVPANIRDEVGGLVAAILDHTGTAEFDLPGPPGQVTVDWSQFRVRGHYAESDLAGYFLAMMWLGQMPIPLDASAVELLEHLAGESSAVDGVTLLDRWRQVDNVGSAFMGRPVDVTLAMLEQLGGERPDLFPALDLSGEAGQRLREMRGPIPFRGAGGALHGGSYPLQLTLFPRRFGQDVTYFTRLTHPDIELRGMPSALDVFAVLGIQQALTHALAAAEGAGFYDRYRAELEALAEEQDSLSGGVFVADIYHGWLAALATLAAPLELPEDTHLSFAANEAWHDRQLFSALAGYAVLKHDAVLYSFQESGVECGGDETFLAFVEQPIIPPPRGFVDPQPLFFRRLSRLAERVYADLNQGHIPGVPSWREPREGEVPDNAATFAARLSELAERCVRGEPLSEEDYQWLRRVGSLLELLFFGDEPYDAFFGGDEGRMERGVSLVTDIYTNLMRGEVVQIGVGRLLDLYVAVPDERAGQRMTQGAIYSFYEFTHDMNARLTDAEWNTMLESGRVPALPSWAASFIEE